MGYLFFLGPGRVDVAAICQVAKGNKAIQAVGPADVKTRKYGIACQPRGSQSCWKRRYM